MQMKIVVFVFDERKPNFLVLLISIDMAAISSQQKCRVIKRK